MKTKKILWIAIALLVMTALTLSACSAETENPNTENQNAYSEPQIGGTLEFGSYVWRILDIQDGKALLISDEILFFRPYQDPEMDTTWAESTLRTYLNEVFYSQFSEAERSRIVETVVQNNDNPWFGTPGGDDTTDKIFLLSIEEVVRYFGDSGQLQNGNPNNDYRIDDSYNSNRQAGSPRNAWWWLRSPGNKSDDAAGIDSSGRISITGDCVDDMGGVRPVLWITL